MKCLVSSDKPSLRRIRTRLSALGAAFGALWLQSCAFEKAPETTLAPLTQWGHDINYVYGITTIICAFVFIAVALPLVYVLYRFRAKNGAEELPKQVHGNAILELTWTLIPVVLLLFIAIPTWRVIFSAAAPAPADAIKVNVIGHQWWWEFQYPDLGITTANELHLPENTPVALTLTSADVIHDFWVPRLGGKVDAFPGIVNTMHFTTPALTEHVPGGEMLQGQCYQLCGLSHALMRFNVVIEDRNEFQNYVKTYNKPPVVETALEKQGSEVFARCVSCHTISGTPSADIPGPKIGPNLSNVGSRHYIAAGTLLLTPANLARWVHNPADVKPGALMPNLGLSDEDIRAVSAYLLHSTAKHYY